MLDIRLIREQPEPSRRSCEGECPPRGRRAARGRSTRGARRSTSSRRCAPSGARLEGDRRLRTRRSASAAIAATRGARRPDRRRRGGVADGRGRVRAGACSRCRTCRTPTCRSAPTSTPTSSSGPTATPPQLRLRAAAALGARRRARHHRLRARREDLRLALLRADGRRRAPAARAHHLDARPAHARARLHRDLPAVHGDGASASSAPATCRSSATTSTATPRRTSGSCPTAEVPVTNLYRDEILDARRAAAQARRLHAVLPAREDVGRARRARHQARPPVRQGRDGQVRRRRTTSDAELSQLLDDAEDVCRRLGLAAPRRPDVHRRPRASPPP